MTREKAMALLNLPSWAGREDIERAYRRLVRRYPPEFHPEKFRDIDEAYRLLTSLAFRVEHSLLPQTKMEIDRDSFSFDMAPPIASLEAALNEIKTKLKIAFLWKPLERENPKKEK